MAKIVKISKVLPQEERIRTLEKKLRVLLGEAGEISEAMEEQGADDDDLDAMTDVMDAMQDACEMIADLLDR